MSKRLKIDLEYIFSSSKPMLFHFLTAPEGLKAWYCQEVSVEGDVYHFSWEGEKESAVVFGDKYKYVIEYFWKDRTPEEKTTFVIEKSPITGETILRISAFCDDDFLDEETIYWDNAIEELKHATGG